MGSCGKPKHLCKCKKKKNATTTNSKKLRYVGKPKITRGHVEYGKRGDGLEKKPRPSQPTGIRFN